MYKKKKKIYKQKIFFFCKEILFTSVRTNDNNLHMNTFKDTFKKKEYGRNENENITTKQQNVCEE